MDRVVRHASQFGKLRLRQDDDIVDRLNYMYTVLILIVCSVIVSSKQYVGDPIQCWTPAHFKGGHDKYANNICWVANTYWLPLYDIIPREWPKREERELGYYQYVPLVLLIQALMFHLPCVFWRALNGKSGINVKSIIQVAVDLSNLNPENRHKTVRYLGRHLELCFDNEREYRSGCFVRVKQMLARTCCLVFGRRYGNYLVFLYMFTKLLYIANVVGELYFLNIFLGTNYTMYGVEVMNQLVHGKDWEQSGHFPRVTMCDFEVRRVGQTHRYTVQCVLTINFFNEKMFIFLWFWFLVVGIITVLNFVKWAQHMGIPASRALYIRKYLKLMGTYNKAEKRLAERFALNYLRHDGVLVMHLIARNAGELVVAEILNVLWHNYKGKPAFGYGNAATADGGVNLTNRPSKSAPNRPS